MNKHVAVNMLRLLSNKFDGFNFDRQVENSTISKIKFYGI